MKKKKTFTFVTVLPTFQNADTDRQCRGLRHEGSFREIHNPGCLLLVTDLRDLSVQFIILDACTDLRDEGPFRAIHNPGCMYRFEGPFSAVHNPGCL